MTNPDHFLTDVSKDFLKYICNLTQGNLTQANVTKTTLARMQTLRFLLMRFADENVNEKRRLTEQVFNGFLPTETVTPTPAGNTASQHDTSGDFTDGIEIGFGGC